MEQGAYELAEALSVNNYLLILNLTGNAICNEGLSYLFPAIVQADTLISLNLTSNEITSGPVRQAVLKYKNRQGYTHSNVQDRSNWSSLKPFRLHGAENMNGEESEKKRYRLQSAFLIKEFI